MKKSCAEIGKRIVADICAYWQFIALFIAYDITVHLLFHAFCPLVIVTGLPCPGCGMSRSVFYFAAGQWEKGWNMNPLGICWLLLGIYFCVMRYIAGKKPRGVLQMGGVLVVLMVLLYGYRMYHYFPGNPPVSYTPGSLLERMIPGYRKALLEWIANIKNLLKAR